MAVPLVPLTLAESQFALAAVASLYAGERHIRLRVGVGTSFRAIVSTEGTLRVRSRRGWDMTRQVTFLAALPVRAILTASLSRSTPTASLTSHVFAEQTVCL